MRISIENTAETMLNGFGIKISEGEIRIILSQLLDSLGEEYENLLNGIRNSPSKGHAFNSCRTGGNRYNLWTFLT